MEKVQRLKQDLLEFLEIKYDDPVLETEIKRFIEDWIKKNETKRSGEKGNR